MPITLGEEPLGEFRFDIEFEPTGHQGAGGAAAGGTEELTFGVEPLEAFEPAPEGGPGMELTAPEAPSLSLGEIPFELPPLEPQGGEQPALHEEWLMAAPEPGPPAAGVREAARPTRPAPEAGEVAEVSETISLELRGVSRARFEELMARAVREAVEEVIRDVVPRLAREILQEELKRGRQP
ncbi:MAG: hypothetical protein HYY85_08515 [Deltaproteobacteria bacterium]|nr:hypothetical protein [Deltaproteobacteria bacterium]